ncbi:Structural maintenance of chromosomes protein 4 [Pseudocercospora fuligena]|uniref:Structural maintenance of chromosomes protein n=1 Tax=Pseudocercospora fuligena TaxID=685502 RepID=A0A8H6VPT5_9PEZI|nr:Structural maintenance of chromosomes protein 4 [Pseudocercospora fuligena]
MADSPVRASRRAAARRKVVVDEEEGSDIENSVVSRQQDQDEEEDFTPAPKSTKSSPRRKTVGDATNRRRTVASRRKTQVGDATEASSIEPSQVFSPPPESVADTTEPPSPTKKSPPKRRTVRARQSRASRVSIASDAPELQPGLPTPQPTVSPEPRQDATSPSGTPLTDITESAINEQTPRQTSRHTPPEEDAEMTDVTMEENPATPKAAHRNPTPPAEESILESTEIAQTPRADTTRIEVKKIDPNVTRLERPMDIVVKKRALGIQPSQEPAAPKERMTITYLTLTNFKSYAGKQVVGPFHSSFSSVVGPNGSGKSNVIDSLLFVFGFRASKMRQGKISALIHNSAQYPDLDYCEVEVHFQMVMDQPGGRSTPIPDSQMIVSRRAFKNNSSKYYIDGKTSDFTTVTTLLKGRGIDLDHKRFLILQGEVESIAQMKPKATGEHDDGLLEYLEDIIGTSKYKTPIDEAATETETLNEVCLEKSGRVQHVEKEKNSLEDKKDKALAYIRDENDLASKQSALYQIYVAEGGDNVQVSEEAIAQIQEQLNEELNRHQGAEEEVKALEKQHKSESKAYDKMEKEAAVVKKQVDDLDKAHVKIEEKKKHLKNKEKKLEKTRDTSTFEISNSEAQAKHAQDDVERLSGQIEDLEQSMQAEEQELAKIRDALKGKTQGISDEIAVKQKQLEPWSAKINEKQSSIAVAQSELDMLRERENAGAKAIEEVEAKIGGLQEQRDAKAGEIDACKKEQKAAEKEVVSVQKQLDGVKAKEPTAKDKMTNARQKAEEARSSLSASKAQGNVLAGLTRLKESGRIDGFHGRLGNLGAIDAKYDIAISTACPSLENMVVDSVEAAQQCIEHLRKNNLGRANFICLDRLPQRDLSAIDTPENCPRLFDLIKSKHERFRPAFYSVLQNTLVAKDSQQADRVAYGAKRWRVVSLEGKLIDKSGVMSGGGNTVKKGAMSSKVTSDTTKEQVQKLQLDSDAVEKEYAAIQEQQRDLESQLRELQSKIPKLETQAQKLSLELGSIERNIDDSQKRIEELGAEQKTSKSDKNKTATLEKSIASMLKEVEKLQSETEGIEAEIKELQDKIMEIGGVKLRGQKAKVDGLREQIEALAERLNNAEVAKTKAEKARQKHEKALRDAEAETEKVAKELEKVEESAQSQTSGNSELRRQYDDAKIALEEKRDELDEMKRQLDEMTTELNNTRGAEVEMRNKLEDNQKHLATNQKQMKYWQEKLSKLTLQNVAEDGEEKDPEPVPELSRDELEDLDKESLKAAIASLEEKTSGAQADLSVLAEYRRRVQEYSSRLEDLNAALSARDAAKKRTDDLRRMRLEGFMEGFSLISMRLKEMYQMITMGGNAELELVDSLDPFSEGILFSVMPPKKSWKNIGNLSGGEKTLSSLALVFALHHYKPTPLYVMDEIDAALDFRNVSIVAAYIKERTKNAQFIVISLRNNMFELASRLVGVYKVNHMTKSVTVENRDYIVPRQVQQSQSQQQATAAAAA